MLAVAKVQVLHQSCVVSYPVKVLSAPDVRATLKGTVKFLFQPAEEGKG